MITQEELVRGEVAEHLRALATFIEEGHIVQLSVEWKGDSDVTTSVSLNKPLDFIACNFEV